ncbi:MAG TPA: hypothetical protein EYH02_05430, partial [Ignisphaera aggregans]|nr:hypothetical protein [Ignisphaera aggregans]
MILRHHGGVENRDILDFSAPLNPYAPPREVVMEIERAVKDRIYISYPNAMYSKLRSAIADFYGIDSEYVLPLNGAAEALYLLLLALKPCSVIVLEPTFGDHAATLTSLNVLYIALQYIERPYMWVAP